MREGRRWWWSRNDSALQHELNVVPGELLIWAADNSPEELLFTINAMSTEGVTRESVIVGRDEARRIRAMLDAWLKAGDRT